MSAAPAIFDWQPPWQADDAEPLANYLQRLWQHEPQIGAFITLSETVAAEAERVARERRQAAPRGPLHGALLAIKDNVDTALLRTTRGSAVFAGHVPQEDAAVVARLRSAGAIIVGKTNLDEFGLGGLTRNAHYGTTRNPRDRERMVGGSSGGSAAAVAAGFCHGAVGTDTGGSIRLPAALCGVVGMKPTQGLVSCAGVLPVSPELDHVGPIASSVAGAAVLLSVMADPQVVAHHPECLAGELEAGVRAHKIGIIKQYAQIAQRFEPAVWRAFEGAVDALRELGVTTVPIDVPALAGCHEAQRILFDAGVAAVHAPLFSEHAAAYSAAARARITAALRIAPEQLARARQAQARLREELIQALTTADALLTPAAPWSAPRLDDAEARLRATMEGIDAISVRTAVPFSLVGLPAVVIPAGRDEVGLPVAVQLAAAHWRDLQLLRAARALERALERRRAG